MLWIAAVLTVDTRAGHQLVLSDANIPIRAETAAAVSIEIFNECIVHLEQVTSHVTHPGGALLKSRFLVVVVVVVVYMQPSDKETGESNCKMEAN